MWRTYMSNKVIPFLGRMKIEILLEDTQEYLSKKTQAETNASKEFMDKFQIVYGEDRMQSDGSTRFEAVRKTKFSNKGRIVEMSNDCFGIAFKERFGSDREYPKLGDVVYFVPNKSYQVDPENKYHIIDDCEIVGYIKAEEYSNE